MSGIAGFYRTNGLERGDELDFGAMVDAIAHRGLDGRGEWVDPIAGICLGHQRFATIDPSPAGRQPMISSSGRFVITMDGEIFNFRDLRSELKAHGARFRSDSDTEVVLEYLEAWGIDRAIQDFSGTFSFALWDRRDRLLWLVADRLGARPLYYWHGPSALLFGSDLRALLAHPELPREVDRSALALYLRYQCVPAPRTIFHNVHKLRPGQRLCLDADELREDRYWDAADLIRRGRTDPLQLEDEHAISDLERLLSDAVSLRMTADVPLGAFLSGGVDSSTLVALMQAQSSTPIRTFAVGFQEGDYDEAQHARAIAQHLGTDHTELYVTPVEAQQVIPSLPEWFSEPFANPSAIPTYLASALARRHVSISISGDGGDEVFGGYNRYTLAPALWRRAGKAPRSLRRFAAASIRTISPPAWDRIQRYGGHLVPRAMRQPYLGEKLHKIAAILPAASEVDLYRRLTSTWYDPARVSLGTTEPEGTPLIDDELSFTEWMMLRDLQAYLPDDGLTKVDRASMAARLTTRTPFLDHRIVEWAWRLPHSLKVRGNTGKWILRQVLFRYVPTDLIERPKAGFAVPLDSWLRGPLKDWARTLLDPDRLSRDGFFDPVVVERCWKEHVSGRRNHQYRIWTILMFQAWLDHWHCSRLQPGRKDYQTRPRTEEAN